MDRDLLKQVILEQHEYKLPQDYIEREINSVITRLLVGDSILIITGVRRSGKSVVLQNIRQQQSEADYYINFDDDRLVNFGLEDFQTLYEVFIELFGEQKSFYFDEIQNIPDWERFVRRLHDQGNKIIITGSNASMLSKELGTRLTGRHVAVTVYPFSFREFVMFKNPSLLVSLEKNTQTILITKQKGLLSGLFNEYLQIGGIPEYVRHKQPEYLQALYENIIYRDIIVLNKLNKPKELKQLVFYVASNIGKSSSFNALRKMLQLGNASTISEYFGYLEDSYLCFILNRYSTSIKKQIMSEKKQYIIDHGLARLIGFRHSDDFGRILENIVFIELKRRGYNVYVHHETKECDFVIQQDNHITAAIQVCKNMDAPETKEREYKGLLDAMICYKLDKGLILTEAMEKTDIIKTDAKIYNVVIMPVWKWLLING